MIVIEPGGNKRVSPPSYTVDVTVVDAPTHTGGVDNGEVTVDDYVCNEIITATTRNSKRLDVTVSIDRPVLYRSSNTAVATVDQHGFITTIAAGVADITIDTKPTKKSYRHVATVTGGQTVRTFISYDINTLGAAITDATAPTGESKSVYSAMSHTAASYTRNPGLWIDVDLTAWAVWSSSTAQRYNGCAISPRHLLLATHAKPSIGSTVRFVTADNQVVDRTLTGIQNLGSLDLSVGLLDSDLPESIKPSRVLPSDYRDYITMVNLPVIAGDQEAKIVAREAVNLGPSQLTHRLAARESLAPFAEAIISGDSGSPIWCLLDGEAVLLGTHWGATSFAPISDSITGINAAMATLGGGYTLDTVDLSSFPSYGA